MLSLVATLIQRRQSVLVREKCRRSIRARGFTLGSFAAEAGISRKTLERWLNGDHCYHVRPS
jgi:lambda repressor-like predicted transcriptional regulator